MENKSPESWISPLVHAEVERLRLNGEARAQFDATVATIDKLERDCALRRIIADTWGTRTFEVAEPNYLSEGLR